MNSIVPRLVAAAFLVLATRSTAQDSSARRYDFNQTPKAAETQDLAKAISDRLYPPELIMKHQACLKITQAQRNIITNEIGKLQAAALQMQWSVSAEAQKLTELLEKEAINEAEALAQTERLIGFETAVKRAQLAMLIRIRNALTPEQRAKLNELRASLVDMSRLAPRTC